MNEILERRLKLLEDNFKFNINKMTNKKILITGANGYIGSILTLILHYNAKLYCLVRDKDKMIKRFQEICGDIDKISIYEDLHKIKDKIDIVIHCAAPTQSDFFIENPIDTVDIIYTNTKNILDFSKKNNVEKVIFLSTMEIYGDVIGDNIVEDDIGKFSVTNTRNSYPLAKQISEFMVHSYSKKYSFSASIVRLTQTIGPTAQINDNRVYMDFIRSALKKSKITLFTKGETKREYIDVFDVAMAIIFIACEKKLFEIYNISNPNIFISIYDLAKTISNKLKAELVFDLQRDTSRYLPPFIRKLNSDKIYQLGWKPLFSLNQSLDDMINYIKDINE
ncbi:NAD(P)-dependent oxidoreductase [Campylobacter lari]|uniref:NAD-dependent epimerase/dehydratase family protein n=1 Tax=Campylobacter TaxID=194 RepID=UPI00126B96EF|nr:MULTISPECIES: NAD(P)-dependent oxidoreductase [Campylobacter]EAJ6150803.1 NAD(P)-dependent oxidoreductase [Campylobacter lari]EHZ4885101.1 NAD(P)-dependent oxidoreductase [Campylobacter lari]MBT0823772.1 NAD(P)-dependent oxidoreductase [Campylobacter lari]MBT0827352.1 NAD(P)-dependent oxidoreductase [Campylobacter lari]MCV3551027.1 NAD(P)-dependent oxidoreductase [Campylobacter sp. CNRCH_2013_0855]